MIFAASAAVSAALLAGFNVAVDPFGVFGDKIFDWYAYDMTQNPRIAKIAYLDEHHGEYDSYIIGSSKTSSYSVEKLNEYTGARFYNMIMYGGDMYDAQKTAEYVINNYEVKNIILNIGIEEMYSYDYEDDDTKGNLHTKVEGESELLFYLKYAFLNPQYSLDKLEAYFERDYLPTADDVFIPETGVYNKTVRDAESITGEAEFFENNPEFYLYREDGRRGEAIDKAVESVRAVKELCESRGIDFKLIASPLYDTEIEDYDYNDLCTYWQKLAEVTDIYDFTGYSPVSMDARYFYDDAHFRNSVGDMALAWIYGDTGVYIPDGFGHSTTRDNAYEYAKTVFARPSERTDVNTYSKKIPVLMYHDIGDEEPDNGMVITPELFEEQLAALRNAGYESVSFAELEEYVNGTGALPERCVVITFDDGYLSNYEYAYPILRKYGFKATVFAVGVTSGAETYKDTGAAIRPHFDWAQAKEMYDSGYVDIQSHTFDMHRVEGLDAEYRDGASKLDGESDAEFAEIFKADLEKSRSDIESAVGNDVFALSFPKGIHSVLTDVCAREAGFDVTVTTEEGVNDVARGLPQSLRGLKRIGMYPNITGEKLLELIR